MRQLREQTVTDLVTSDGELLRVVEQRVPGRTYGRQFLILFTEAMKVAAKRIRHGMTWRVLHLLPEHLNFTDFRMLRTVELAAELDSDSGTVSRAMRELLELNILEREGTGARTAWRFSSDWGWQGSADQYHAFRGGRLAKKKAPVAALRTGQSHNSHYGNKRPQLSRQPPAPYHPTLARRPTADAAASRPSPCQCPCGSAPFGARRPGRTT